VVTGDAPFEGHVVGQKSPASPPEEPPLLLPPLEEPELLPLPPPLEELELLPLLPPLEEPELLPLEAPPPPSSEGGVLVLDTHAKVIAPSATNEPSFRPLGIFLFLSKWGPDGPLPVH
jgi:hypothetical protein